MATYKNIISFQCHHFTLRCPTQSKTMAKNGMFSKERQQKAGRL